MSPAIVDGLRPVLVAVIYCRLSFRSKAAESRGHPTCCCCCCCCLFPPGAAPEAHPSSLASSPQLSNLHMQAAPCGQSVPDSSFRHLALKHLALLVLDLFTTVRSARIPKLVHGVDPLSIYVLLVAPASLHPIRLSISNLHVKLGHPLTLS